MQINLRYQELNSLISWIKLIKKLVVAQVFLRICHSLSSNKIIGPRLSWNFFILISVNPKINLIILMINLLLTIWYAIRKNKIKILRLTMKSFNKLIKAIIRTIKYKTKKICQVMKMRSNINIKYQRLNSIIFTLLTTLKKP